MKKAHKHAWMEINIQIRRHTHIFNSSLQIVLLVQQVVAQTAIFTCSQQRHQFCCYCLQKGNLHFQKVMFLTLDMHVGLDIAENSAQKTFQAFLNDAGILDHCALHFFCEVKPSIAGFFYTRLALTARLAKPSITNPLIYLIWFS